ncbi:GtrA family protein [Noviherbaspirillum saxi]|uniref:GtrA family protein n=1 Tax=Noviherbaspirillum saxi TaxID=2320863 RepID=A0A3A3FUV8_9BURK|nr:GtrA family protein [Noviherbaspirillum saxi]RJF99360.1 GtrA family protein [Noviherbaspirillum saxi]
MSRQIPGLRWRQAQRFFVSGVLVTGLHVLVAASVIRFLWPNPAYANGIAFVTATVASYLINTRWSFSSSFRSRSFYRFCMVALAGCLLAMGVSGLADAYGWSYWIGIAAVVMVVPPVTFVLHSRWTYR